LAPEIIEELQARPLREKELFKKPSLRGRELLRRLLLEERELSRNVPEKLPKKLLKGLKGSEPNKL
jgi:hypothetical protein